MGFKNTVSPVRKSSIELAHLDLSYRRAFKYAFTELEEIFAKPYLRQFSRHAVPLMQILAFVAHEMGIGSVDRTTRHIVKMELSSFTKLVKCRRELFTKELLPAFEYLAAHMYGIFVTFDEAQDSFLFINTGAPTYEVSWKKIEAFPLASWPKAVASEVDEVEDFMEEDEEEKEIHEETGYAQIPFGGSGSTHNPQR